MNMKRQKKLCKLFLVIIFLFSVMILQHGQPANHVKAANVTIKYKYNGKNKTYKGKNRSIQYNGKTIALNTTKPFVWSNNNMAPYYETFVKSSIKATKKYVAKTKTVTLKANGHTVIFQVNSKNVTVDGVKKKLSVAPKLITYRTSGKKRIIVPVKSISKYLGLSYSYSSKTGIMKLTKKEENSKDNKKPEDTTQVPDTSKPEISTKNKELHAMWISYIEFQAYLDSYSQNQKSFTKFIGHLYDKCVSNHMNAVIVHVRPFGDAIYNSSYFPWSKYISGKQGKNPGFDPLPIMISEAHKRNLEFHAWLNPYRVSFDTSYSKLASDNPAVKWHNSSSQKRNVLSYGGKLYYNPSKPEVRELIINGVKEIVQKYDVDGIHFDDYFYPSFTSSNVTTAFDATEYNAYKKEQKAAGKSYKSIYNWRRDNVNQLVSGVYQAVKSIKPTVEFGISPAGNIDNLKSNTSYYVDIDTWLNKAGYVDYIMPQIYWGFTHKTAAYDKVLDRWAKLNSAGIVDLHIGIGVYKVGMAKSSSYSDWKEWQQDSDLLAKQITYARNSGKVKGFAFFSYEYFDTSGDIKFSSKSFSASRKKYLTNAIANLNLVLKQKSSGEDIDRSILPICNL